MFFDAYKIGTPISETGDEETETSSEERFLHLLKPTEFGKAYAKALEATRPKDRDLSTIEGEWITFQQTEDPAKVKALADFLQGKGTDWCTAGVETATAHLQAGDFHIFASYDEEGNAVNPRVAIRMENGQVAEVRGIKKGQEIEPQLIETAELNLHTLPGGEMYQQKAADMKFLTSIEKKNNEGKTLTKDELRFLYEVDRKIQGFGYGDDPRIQELISQRDKKEDGSFIFECQPEQIALDMYELTDETKVLFAELNARGMTTMPEQLSHVLGSADFRGSRVETLGNLTTVGGSVHCQSSQLKTLGNLTTIGRDAEFRGSQLKTLGNLTTIGGRADFGGTQVESLGNLTTIGGTVAFRGSRVESLGNLSTIGGSASFKESQVKSLGNLTFIGYNLIVSHSQIDNLGKLTHIGMNFYCDKIDPRLDTEKLTEILQGEIVIEQ